jgi:uncharacterized membrane protein YjjB (DUF3815 family)
VGVGRFGLPGRVWKAYSAGKVVGRMTRRLIIAVIIAHFVASYIGGLVCYALLSQSFDPNPPLLISKPALFPLMPVAAFFQGADSEQSFAILVYLVTFGSIYVVVRSIQDGRGRRAMHVKM